MVLKIQGKHCLQTAEFRIVFAFKMAISYENLQLIAFNKEMRRRAINNKGNIENVTISKALGIPIRTIQDIRKELKRSGNPEMVIKRKTKPEETSRTVRDVNFIARV